MRGLRARLGAQEGDAAGAMPEVREAVQGRVRVHLSGATGANRAIGVVWISCWPSKPVTRVRILYRPPSGKWAARIAHIRGAGRETSYHWRPLPNEERFPCLEEAGEATMEVAKEEAPTPEGRQKACQARMTSDPIDRGKYPHGCQCWCVNLSRRAPPMTTAIHISMPHLPPFRPPFRYLL